jgi:hypothetical protein
MYKIKIFTLIVLTCSLSACNSQNTKKQGVPVKIQKIVMNDTTPNNNKVNYFPDSKMYLFTTDKLDIKKFKANVSEDASEYEYKMNDGTTVNESYGADEDGRFIQILTPQNSIFQVYKGFYESGKIKIKGFRASSFYCGIWHTYDEQGKIIQTKDYDIPFTYTWEDLKQYCNEKNINLKDGKTSIERYNTDSTKQSQWQITYWGNYEKKLDYDRLITITKDGKTGELLLVKYLAGKERVEAVEGVSSSGTVGVFKTLYEKPKK